MSKSVQRLRGSVYQKGQEIPCLGTEVQRILKIYFANPIFRKKSNKDIVDKDHIFSYESFSYYDAISKS